MLAELYIRDFAIIDDLRMQFCPGFNVLTGETGAGKSIILDAMSLVLGERADATMVRTGCEISLVEARFQLEPRSRALLTELLEAEGLETDEEDSLLLARELRLNGRNICRVNGRAVNLSILREIGEQLVDIHGQGEHLSLLKARSHLPLLDSYAGLGEDRANYALSVRQLRAIRKELRELRQDKQMLRQRVEMLNFQIAEIDAAKLSPGEEEELRVERTRLANVEQLIRHSNETLAHLSGTDGELPSASDMLGQAERAVVQLTKLDDSLQPFLERLQGFVFQIDELAAELIGYQSKLEFDPDRLGFVEERIELISNLKRKYGNDVEAVLARREEAAAELEAITYSEERIEELSVLDEQCLREVGRLAENLSERRRSAAKSLASAVERELAALNMDQATFRVDFAQQDDDDGVVVGDRRLAFDETGIDKVEFLVTANPGESLKPLAKVASGGETSRLMLALKTVLAEVDATPTLIFDEIDQGIGGRVGDVVGHKLWRLTSPAKHQVVVVTHLPQLAGYADGHYRVIKLTVGGRNTASVKKLDKSGRVRELAEMLGTEDEHATGGAESIIQRVALAKSAA